MRKKKGKFKYSKKREKGVGGFLENKNEIKYKLKKKKLKYSIASHLALCNGLSSPAGR
jgi:hypothetical protein